MCAPTPNRYFSQMMSTCPALTGLFLLFDTVETRCSHHQIERMTTQVNRQPETAGVGNRISTPAGKTAQPTFQGWHISSI
ncbi:hypothetical protein CLOSTMETH_01469 [[Clostridium] methylpentosum DSM 5476]|uniref:Uncharacterized protein n=1 Tax=[Clostridium] methylpentosum DSM 5476 TaxID=537013 RepID=C0ECA0_9FIRM|nr:hypothetical protein CLOSTMETH_01469 [[Clostridium] methylpentosum DSM 5476]